MLNKGHMGEGVSPQDVDSVKHKVLCCDKTRAALVTSMDFVDFMSLYDDLVQVMGTSTSNTSTTMMQSESNPDAARSKSCNYLTRVLENDLLSMCLFSYLDVSSKASLVTCSSTVHSLLIGHDHFVMQLALASMGICLGDESSSLFTDIKSEYVGGWRGVLRDHVALKRRLGTMESPGCSIQKYLSSFQGLAADSKQVQSVIKGVALLPESLALAVGERNAYRGFSDQLLSALKMMYTGDANTREVASAKPYLCRRPAKYEFDSKFITRYMTVLDWVTQHQDHLRLIMAQHEQLRCRSFGHFPSFNERCITSLIDLIYMGNNEVGNLEFWA